MQSLKNLLCFALSLLPSLLAADASFTLNQIMSAPFASAPIASPTAAKVAWLENEEGKRNVFIAAAPDWKAHRLTSFSKDDGQEIGDLAWAHDGSYLLFVRGGDFENGGENPNPAVDATTPEQEIWFASAEVTAASRNPSSNQVSASAKRIQRDSSRRAPAAHALDLP